VDANLVSRDREIMSGALCFTGTRVPVQHLFDYLEETSSLKPSLAQPIVRAWRGCPKPVPSRQQRTT